MTLLEYWICLVLGHDPVDNRDTGERYCQRCGDPL